MWEEGAGNGIENVNQVNYKYVCARAYVSPFADLLLRCRFDLKVSGYRQNLARQDRITESYYSTISSLTALVIVSYEYSMMVELTWPIVVLDFLVGRSAAGRRVPRQQRQVLPLRPPRRCGRFGRGGLLLR